MSVEVFTEELDRLYEFEIEKYIKECDDLKRMGYKIYRNSEGKHKVVEPPKVEHKYDQYGKPDVSKIFEGTPFADVFSTFGG